MKFARSGQETRYLYCNFWNRSRIEKDLFKFSLTSQESRILTIQISFQEEIKQETQFKILREEISRIDKEI